MSRKPAHHRIIVTSDWHCGASTGLTRADRRYGQSELIAYEERRLELWHCFSNAMLELGYLDELWVVGDMVNGPIDGRARRDNLVQMIDQQEMMAIDILEWIQANMKTGSGKRWDLSSTVIVEGTEWHCGDGTPEHRIAGIVGATATKGKIFYRNGFAFDIKHYVGGSHRAHLLGNSLVQEYMAAVANHNQHGTPVPDVVIRAHRHTWVRRDGVALRDGVKVPWSAIMLPALEAWGSDFAKRLSANVYPDVGFVCVDILGGTTPTLSITPHLFHLTTQAPKG